MSTLADLVPLTQHDADILLGRLWLSPNQALAAEELSRPCCPRCGIPRSEYSGHWCALEEGSEQWRGWDG